jgi:NAD(P)-dependent dehydrogenase (short-subunit alcohol dehydrogenase family)
MHLNSKVALVTGAGHGIGRTLARRLADDGASVIVNCPSERAEADSLVDEIQSSGGKALAVEADIADPEAREAMFELALSRFGALHILVNNAAVDPGPSDPLKLDEEFFDRILAVNLKAAFFCAQAAARSMVDRGIAGRIINISSIHGQQNLPGCAPYSISKGGLNAMTRQLAIDLAPHGITVNAIAPGFIEVDRTIGRHEKYNRDTIASVIPVRRVGFPADIASLVCYLAGDDTGFLTGQVIPCDGGQTARMSFRPDPKER